MDTYAGAVATAYDSNLAPLASTQYHMIEALATDLSSPTAGEGTAVVDSPGTRTGTTLPADICALERLHVNRRYRGGHPRIYWPFGVAADQQDAQTWKSDFTTECLSDLDDWHAAVLAISPGSASSIEFANVSYYTGFTVHTGVTGRAKNVPTPRATPIVDAITAFSVPFGMASQRRRLLGLA